MSNSPHFQSETMLSFHVSSYHLKEVHALTIPFIQVWVAYIFLVTGSVISARLSGIFFMLKSLSIGLHMCSDFLHNLLGVVFSPLGMGCFHTKQEQTG